MKKPTTTLQLFAVGVCLAGLLVSWWPLALLGVLLAACWGSVWLALLLGALLDLFYGAPTGWLHILRTPFFLLALACLVLRLLLTQQLRPDQFDRV